MKTFNVIIATLIKRSHDKIKYGHEVTGGCNMVLATVHVTVGVHFYTHEVGALIKGSET